MALAAASLWLSLGACRSACEDDPSDKPTGWPRVGRIVEGILPEPDVSVRDAAVAVTPEADAVDADAGPETDADRGEPCIDLVERACELMGRHTEECAEARSLLRPPPSPAADLACATVRTEFEEWLVIHKRMSACRSLAYRKCRALGSNTEACKRALEDIPRLLRPEQRKACQADILLWEARHALRRTR